MIPTREIVADGWCVRLDPSRQVLRLEVPEADTDRRRGDPPLSPVLPPGDGGPVSAATLLLKAKLFDDRLYAAVELAARRGAGRFVGKATLLRSLATTLAAELPVGVGAATAIHTACKLGGLDAPIPESLAEAVRTAEADFLGNELLSKPIGFYAWSPELSAIFRQDRFLQRPLDPETADDLAGALRRTPGAADAYDACLRLNARLTNPPKGPGLRDAGTSPPFFPPSRSHEVNLLERLYEDRPIPEGFDLMGEIIRRVRSGDISLEPADDAGWYDHQTWSLEPLVVPDRMPERSRLELGKRYRKHLEDLFRGAMALARETHVKQAGGGRGGYSGPTQPPIWVGPGLSVEPLRSLYTRRAACYRFVRSVIEEAFGSDGLREMQRITPDEGAAAGLAEELVWIEELFAAATVTASRELGLMSAVGGDARRFSAWRASLAADRDVGRDVRTMVPVFYDEQRKRMKVWVFLGWRTTPVVAEYRVPPAVLEVVPFQAAGRMSADPPAVEFRGERYEFAVPVMAEVYVTRLLDRDEFRGHCDRHKTRDAILTNLE